MKCRICGDGVDERRWLLGFKLCLLCGEEQARQDRMGWCIAGINKSNPMLITDRETLKQLNPKRTT